LGRLFHDKKGAFAEILGNLRVVGTFRGFEIVVACEGAINEGHQ
jgi:hypothetical protein